MWRISSLVSALVLVLLGCFAGTTALAAPPPVFPTQLCVRASETLETPSSLLAVPNAFDCQRNQIGVVGRYTWLRVTGLNLVSNPNDPWQVRHEYTTATSETLFVRYADGRLVQAPSDRMSARRLFSPGLAAFALPAQSGRITDILIRVEGLQHQRGITSRIELRTERAALDADLLALFLYGLLGGGIVALLAYNLALYATLRYKFILCYCLSSVSALALGMFVSGGIFLIFPKMDTSDQISWMMLGGSTVMATGALFMISFIEREALPRLVTGVTIGAAMVGLLSSVSRIVDHRFAWHLMDQISYGMVVAVLFGLLASSGLAWRRGSASARMYCLAWSVPIVLGIARAVWGAGLIGESSTLIAMSPLIFMAIEALMASLAVSWRIGQLRSERDAARAMHVELRHAADTDPLTGLLNRRSFIEGALQSTGRQRLILIDIDRFKRVNDRFGHQAGDDVLVRVAAQLLGTAPAYALVGRLGGEEFAVLAPATPVDALADRLCRAVAGSAEPDGLSVTISAGVADASIDSDAGWRQLYHAADQALYRAKNGGRNRVSHAPQPIAA